MSLDNVTLDNLASTDTAVVRALGSRETTRGPAEGTAIEIEESVLLLETEPRLVVGVGLHDLVAVMAVVVLVGGTIGVPALGKNDNVGGTAERIGEDGAGAQVDIGVVAGGLVSGRTIEVPDGEIFGLPLLFLECLQTSSLAELHNKSTCGSFVEYGICPW